MLLKSICCTVLVSGLTSSCLAQEKPGSDPIELKVLRTYVGVWDAEIEVWPSGLDSDSIRFKGVETNRLYGKHWIASDFDSSFEGETMKVHSIVGYDLDRKKLVGTVIDHGPYAASMTGDYDQESKTVRWTTEAKAPNGDPMVQKTRITQKSSEERVLVMSVPGGQTADLTKFMEIGFTKRK